MEVDSFSTTDSSLSTPPVTDLYLVVREGRASLQQTAADWVELYQADREGALGSLVKLVLRSAGCGEEVVGDCVQLLLAGEEMASVVTRAMDDDQNEECLLTVRGMAAKKFTANFSEFLQRLVDHCQNSIVYDQFLVDTLLSLLVPLSSCQARSLRHTGTLASLELMTSFVFVSASLSEQEKKTDRQLQSEAGKESDKRAADRLELLENKLEEFKENQLALQEMLEYLFKSVFVHRVRDVSDEIRCLCISRLGSLFQVAPQLYVADQYLKYIGWSLNDKSDQVRLASIQTLQTVFQLQDSAEKTELFVTKFKDRIVSMVMDKELEVAREAVLLNTCLARLGSITDEDFEQVSKLVYSRHRRVARAAGTFLVDRLVLDNRGHDQSGLRSRRGKVWRPNTFLLRDVVQFFCESDMPGHEGELVDSLQETSCPGLMTDWESFTDLLLEEAGQGHDGDDDQFVVGIEERTALISLMVNSVKQAATGGAAEGKVLTVKEVKKAEDMKMSISSHFAMVLPHLIQKHIEDPSNVEKLLEILPLLSLDIFSNQTKYLDDLLDLISEVLEKHSEENVLKAAARTLELLSNPELTLSARCASVGHQVIDRLLARFRESLEDYDNILTNEREPGVDEVEALINSLTRVSSLYMTHDLSAHDLWPMLLTIVERAQDCCRQDLELWEPEEAVRQAGAACYYSLLWDKLRLTRGSHNEEVQQLRDRLTRFIIVCDGFLDTNRVESLVEDSFISLCDLWVSFSRMEQKGLKQLTLRPDRLQVERLEMVLREKVFQDLEERQLAGRKKMLACYLKLIMSKTIPVRCFSPVLRHLVHYEAEFGVLIKDCLGQIRDMDRSMCAKLMVQTLADSLADLQVKAPDSSEFTDLRLLAKKFALLLGVDKARNREAVTNLHLTGIDLAMKGEDSVLLLELVAEFSGRLLPQDKKVVLTSLKKKLKTTKKMGNFAAEAIKVLQSRLSTKATMDD